MNHKRCATVAGYWRHKTNGEHPCNECSEVMRKNQLKPIKHGTHNGYHQHKRRDEIPCRECIDASTKYKIEHSFRTVECFFCKKLFDVKSVNKGVKLCSLDCRRKYRATIKKEVICLVCNKTVEVELRHQNRTTCSTECRKHLLKLRQDTMTHDDKRLKSLKSRCTYHGITVDQYNEILEKQNGVCAICESPETTLKKNGFRPNLAIDHCHETGKIRALLCNKCNTMIGLASDNFLILEAAQKYVEHFSMKYNTSKQSVSLQRLFSKKIEGNPAQ